MRVRHLLVQNFRGIKDMSWTLGSRFAVLIGPGDAGKSTVLDALTLTTSSQWNPHISDADFYNGDTSKSIVIEATLTDLPEALIREDRFGHCLRGVSPSGELHREPEASDEIALTVRLTVESTLEPQWEVIRESREEGVRISASARSQLGVFQLSDSGRTHLRWGRNSALSHLGELGEINVALLNAHRAARAAIFEHPPPACAQE